MRAAKTGAASKGRAQSKVLECLQQVFEGELAGVIRYLHYSFMIMGHNRIPIQHWFRSQARESMDHAVMIGEKITSLGGHPSVASAHVEETNLHSVEQILKESLIHEEKNLALYRKLAKLAGNDVALEELARQFIRLETEHVDEVKKMLRGN